MANPNKKHCSRCSCKIIEKKFETLHKHNLVWGALLKTYRQKCIISPSTDRQRKRSRFPVWRKKSCIYEFDCIYEKLLHILFSIQTYVSPLIIRIAEYQIIPSYNYTSMSKTKSQSSNYSSFHKKKMDAMC